MLHSYSSFDRVIAFNIIFAVLSMRTELGWNRGANLYNAELSKVRKLIFTPQGST